MSHTVFLIYITRVNALTYSIHIFPYVPRRENRLNIFLPAHFLCPAIFYYKRQRTLRWLELCD